MSKYDVYGLGNALVDYEYLVDDEFLKKHQLEKGTMSLVNESQQQKLILDLGQAYKKRSPGGSAANTITAFTQCENKAYYSCKVASDEDGIFYLDDMNSAGISTNPHPKNIQGVTGKCIVMITPDAERTMATFLGITQDYGVSEVNENDLLQSKWAYIEGYLMASRVALDAALLAKKMRDDKKIKLAVTLSDPGIVDAFRGGFEEIIAGDIDFIFANEREALIYSETKNLKDAILKLKNVSKQFVITRSEKGAIIWDGVLEHEIKAPSINAIDANGAGDMFAGVFLNGLCKGHDLRDTGTKACQAASKIVTKFGTRLENHEIKECLSMP